eukprot:TRINITY_DN107280_c0_g1_i1.p1 TRINITY_DN107280_c0_g1~~TRINITY_DN107280_c0_g1_i1.p1  ORF type:complete len:142 (+),score=27.20 TRINITY_DN107280_c0_g1_i1:61-486(+)
MGHHTRRSRCTASCAVLAMVFATSTAGAQTVPGADDAVSGRPPVEPTPVAAAAAPVRRTSAAAQECKAKCQSPDDCNALCQSPCPDERKCTDIEWCIANCDIPTKQREVCSQHTSRRLSAQQKPATGAIPAAPAETKPAEL